MTHKIILTLALVAITISTPPPSPPSPPPSSSSSSNSSIPQPPPKNSSHHHPHPHPHAPLPLPSMDTYDIADNIPSVVNCMTNYFYLYDNMLQITKNYFFSLRYIQLQLTITNNIVNSCEGFMDKILNMSQECRNDVRIFKAALNGVLYDMVWSDKVKTSHRIDRLMMLF